MLAVAGDCFYCACPVKVARSAVRCGARKIEAAKNGIFAEWVRPEQRRGEHAEPAPCFREQKGKVEYLQLLGWFSRLAEPQEPLLHQGVIQVIELDIEQRVSIWRLLEWYCCAPHLGPIRAPKPIKEIAKALNDIHVGEDQVDGEPRLRPGHYLVQASPQYLGLLLDF